VQRVKNTSIGIVLFVVIINPAAWAGSAPGTYNHEAQTAYLIVHNPEEPNDTTVVRLNWAEQELTELASGERIRYLSINHDRSLIAYQDRNGEYFKDAHNGEEIFHFEEGEHWGAIKWAGDRNRALHWDSGTGTLFDINVDTQTIKRVKTDRKVWHSAWSSSCECFLVQFGSYEGAALNEVYQVTRDGLVKDDSIKTLTASPDRKYYFQNKQVREMKGSLAFYEYKTENKIGEVNAVVPLGDNRRFLWEGQILYPIIGKDRIDVSEASVVSGAHWFYSEEDEVKIRPLAKAADWERYSLLWDEDAGKFEVYEIKTGETIRQYEKFWDGMIP